MDGLAATICSKFAANPATQIGLSHIVYTVLHQALVGLDVKLTQICRLLTPESFLMLIMGVCFDVVQP